MQKGEITAQEGSSPRGRGKPADRALSGKWSGLIPAWAGKTAETSLTTTSRRAHPRVGGENADSSNRRSTT